MAETLPLTKPLPVNGSGPTSSAWWGVWTLILTEGSLFGYLLLSYFYLYFQKRTAWPPDGLPELVLPGINTVILLSSSVWVWLGELCLKRNRVKLALVPMAAAIVFGATFVAIQLKEYADKPYHWDTHLYGSLFFTITGFHMLHVVVGLIVLSVLWVWTALGYFNKDKYTAVTIGGLYWHFVDAVWIFVFSSLYLSPYVLGR